ncbi:amino acid adenylation domain-containing protein [Kitasatospora cineracea]|uniref:amino acid adenylation domain-containing protein n=1 Tax=Kitasatospora cineracea TaxID=88074 RepID=UPI003787E959
MNEARSKATPEQVEVWLAVQREPESGRFNIPVDLEFTPGVDLPALRGALQDLASRHPLLRSAFVTEGPDLLRVEHPTAPVPLMVRRSTTPYDPATAAREAAALSARPFDTTRAPLLRAEVLHHPDGALLVLVVHHLVCDGWSQQVLLDDLIAAYRTRLQPTPSEPATPMLSADNIPPAPPMLSADNIPPAAAVLSADNTPPTTPSAPVLSADNIAPTAPVLSADNIPSTPPVLSADNITPATAPAPDAAAAYWQGLLGAELPSLAPLPDLNRPSATPGAPAWETAALDARTMAGIRDLARAELASPATVLLACWLTLLHAWSAAEAGTSGMLFAARHGDERSVDLQARVLPVVSEVSAGTVFRDLVVTLRDQVWDSLDHCTVPSAQLRTLRRDAGHRSLIDPCVFMHFPEPEGEWEVPGARIRLVEHDTPAAKYDFSLVVLEQANGARVRVDFDSAVYRSATARVFLDQFTALAAAAAADPAASCGALVAGSDTFTPFSAVDDTLPLERTPVHELVLARAARTPDAIALRHGPQTVTYRELAHRAQALSTWLRTRGVRNGDLVALLLPRGTTSIVLWLATLIAGVGYLPLDPVYPDAQLQAVLDDAAPRITIGTDGLLGRVTLPPGSAFTVEEALWGALDRSPTAPAPAPVRVSPDGVFNVLYTSGSTGRPKGVVLSHEGFTRLLSRPDFLDLDETDVVAHLCPLNFDGATYEVWGALAAGAEVVVVGKELVLSPEELRTVFLEHGVTTMLASTPLMNRLIEDVPDVFQTLRRVFCGGEMISVPHMSKVLRWAAPGTVLHGYGPTENSFTSTWWPVTEADDCARTVPIGAPVPGTRAVVVMDPVGMRAAPRGVPGELWLGGAGLARGYLGDPAATARRYVPDGFSGLPGQRLYRTGDRVRWTPDGLLEFIGRDDNQVKIRSQRVELGEVTSALAAHPQVQAAVVSVVRNRRGEKELAGFAVLEPGGRTEEVRAHLRTVLPSFAVPRYLIALDEMPLTPNGKVDRKRLPDPTTPPVLSADNIPPAPPMLSADNIPSPTPMLSADNIPPATATAPTVAPAVTDAPSTVEAVRAAWISLVEHDDFGPDDNFFDAGGHSLLLVALAQALRERLGTAPSVADLLRHTTVRAQATLLSATAPATTPPVLSADNIPPAPPVLSADNIPSPTPMLSADNIPPAAAVLSADNTGPTAPVLSADNTAAAPAAHPGPTPRILVLSARDGAALAAIRSALADHLERTPGLRLADVATTLQQGREALDHRYAVVATDLDRAARALRTPLPGTPGVEGRKDPKVPARVIWSFGGTTADTTTARALAGSPSARRRTQEAGLPGTPGRTGPVELFAAQLGLAEELTDRGLTPAAVTGAGAGLVTALVVAGALDFPAGLRLAEALAAPDATPAGLTALLRELSPGPARTPLAAPVDDPAALAAALLSADGRPRVPATAPGTRTVVVDTGVGARPGMLSADNIVVPLTADTTDDTTTDDGNDADAAPRTRLLTAVARLWCHGVPVALTEGTPGRRLRLPVYRFERAG